MLSANEIKVIKEQAYAGFPSRLGNVCDVYPGMMRDLLKMGRNIYDKRLGILLLTDSEAQDFFKQKTNQEINITAFDYLLQSASVNDTFFLELTEAFSTFIKEEILLLPKINAVLVGPMAERRLITKSNFEDFQNILRLQNRRTVPEPPPENESAIARKMRLKREQREAVKRKQQQSQGSGQDLADLLEIAEVFGINYLDKSIYAFYGLIQRHQRREKWNQDLQMLCAGADPQKVKTEYWGENSNN